MVAIVGDAGVGKSNIRSQVQHPHASPRRAHVRLRAYHRTHSPFTPPPPLLPPSSPPAAFPHGRHLKPPHTRRPHTSCVPLRRQFTDDVFEESSLATVGVDFSARTVLHRGLQARVQIWDAAGDRRLRTIDEPHFYRRVHG